MSFDDFWSHYPKKVGKGAARKAWEKLNPDKELIADIMFSVDQQKRYKKEAKTAGEFEPPWKHPATWLNQECWEDEIKSFSRLKEKVESRNCKCGQPVQFGKYCQNCYEAKVPNPYREELKAIFLKNEVHKLKTPEEHRAYIKKVMR